MEVRPKYRDVGMGSQRGQGFGRGVTVLVAYPRRDNGGGRADRFQEPERRRRVRAVMTDFEQVDERQEAALDQHVLDWSLGIAGEERGEAAMA